VSRGPGAAWALAAALLAACAAGAQVTLRDGSVVESPVTGVSAAGVAVATDPPATITWDRVLRVDGEHAADAERYAEMADDLWRARTRLARGDVSLSAPIFEAWFARDDGPTGATRLVVAEGLLVCRLARLAQVASVEPWLEALRLRRALGGPIEPGFPSALDPATGLAPALAPVWLDGPAVEAFAVTPIEPTGDDLVDALAAMLRESAAIETGAPVVGRAATAIDHDGARLVRAMIDAISGVPAVRERARTILRSGLSRDEGTWREAWRRAALGRSLLLESDLESRDAGLVHLAHLPARFTRSQPYLAGVALALMADEFARRGDHAAAGALRADLAGLADSHPARAWLAGRRRVGAPDATRDPTAADSDPR